VGGIRCITHRWRGREKARAPQLDCYAKGFNIMKVDNKTDRLEMPEECDNCGYMTKLERFYHFGPGHNVNWLCPYCCLDHSHGQNDIIKTIAGMLNELEKRITKK